MIRINHETFKDCFLRVPYNPSSITVKVLDGSKVWYLSCMQGPGYEISSVFGKSLGLSPKRGVLIEHVPAKLCKKVEVEPSDEDSWEMISLNCDYIETRLLSQIKVIQSDTSIPVWIHNHHIWLRILNVPEGWGLLQRDSEIMVKPKPRQAKLNHKDLKAIKGDFFLDNNEFPDDSVLACIKDNTIILGLSRNKPIKQGFVASNLLEKFCKYKVHRVFPVQENIKCFLNKFSFDIKLSPADFVINCSEEELLGVMIDYKKIVIYDGMVFVHKNKEIRVEVTSSINTQEWIGLILLSDPGLVTCKPPSVALKALKAPISLPSFNSFCLSLQKELDTYSVVTLQGGPGVGKSSIITMLSCILEESYIASCVLSCRNISKKEFHKRVSEAIEMCNEKSPCVLFLDDLEYPAGKTEDTDAQETRLIACQNASKLLGLLDSNKSAKTFKVFITCKHKTCLNYLLLSSSYLNYTFTVPSINQQDVSLLVSNYFARGLSVPIYPLIKSYTITDIINFCKLANIQLHKETLSISDLAAFNTKFTPEALEKKELGKVIDWSEIGGMFEVKQKIIDAFQSPIRLSVLYSTYPLKLRSGILLFGPPGCGKTLIGSSIGQMCEMITITVKGPELLNKYIGSSEQAIREVFERAKRVKPSVIVFDEFESIVPKRGSTPVTDRIVNQFLCELDGVEGRDNVYVIAISSRPELIDQALLRPGRLDFHLYCGFPDYYERADIFKVLCGKLGIHADYNSFAAATEGFTGADIQGLMNNIQIKTANSHISQVTVNDIGQEIQSFHPSFTKTQIQAYEHQYDQFIKKKTTEIGKKLLIV